MQSKNSLLYLLDGFSTLEAFLGPVDVLSLILAVTVI